MPARFTPSITRFVLTPAEKPQFPFVEAQFCPQQRINRDCVALSYQIAPAHEVLAHVRKVHASNSTSDDPKQEHAPPLPDTVNHAKVASMQHTEPENVGLS
jgi:hypothetical protein